MVEPEFGTRHREANDKNGSPGLAKQIRNAAAEHGVGPLPTPPVIDQSLIELGRALAFDKILSGNRNISCMTCHHPTLGTGDARQLSLGQGGSGLGELRLHPEGVLIPRNAPPLYNLHALDTMFWDGRVQIRDGVLHTPAGAALTPEMQAVFDFGVVSAQAMFPVTSREEMRGFADPGNELGALGDTDFQGIWAGLMARLGAVPQYVTMFEAAYPGTDFADMSFAHAANAIAAFEIAEMAFLDSPWDRFLDGDDAALTQAQLQGAKRFFDDGCASCHGGPSFTDLQHHNTALGQLGPGKGNGDDLGDDWGRYNVTGDPADRYAFRTPPLRNVELTGPWGHAGQLRDLGAFIAHYIDPEGALATFDCSDCEPETAPTFYDNRTEVATSISPLMDEVTINGSKATDITTFMSALTDDAARSIEDVVPASVPSGLPVAD